MSLNNIDNNNNPKRSEEIYKFFGKRFIKYLQKNTEIDYDECKLMI